jgi:hypothetical protein
MRCRRGQRREECGKHFVVSDDEYDDDDDDENDDALYIKTPTTSSER